MPFEVGPDPSVWLQAALGVLGISRHVGSQYPYTTDKNEDQLIELGQLTAAHRSWRRRGT